MFLWEKKNCTVCTTRQKFVWNRAVLMSMWSKQIPSGEVKKKERRSSFSPSFYLFRMVKLERVGPRELYKIRRAINISSFVLGRTTSGSLRGHFMILVWTFESVRSRIPISSVLSSSGHWRFTFHLFRSLIVCLSWLSCWTKTCHRISSSFKHLPIMSTAINSVTYWWDNRIKHLKLLLTAGK
jgi:hypothetical protein